MATTTKKPTPFEQQRREAAEKAAAIIAANATRTPAEQAALNAIDQDRWVLWHTDHTTDLALAVIRLLSRADLLRDKEHEKRQAEADQFWAGHGERTRAAERAAIGRLNVLAEQAADRLDAGDDPAEVAKWLRETRDRIAEAREKATSTSNS
ncbi:predicted protein [Streptomyces viridosporus ATCC 14672]|uniref:Predicted protein n=1 Tax=Streptomyces viridosporus (strain ATCC 14672 / DSM 40746 / JCM 4963 / KCTC 9882 / NRRL B-12104 / FH 1290) TaxID=566461 RepID=D6A4K7_STRV1|nr:hypothetical protein [Streptomyces viridosporus]EFE65847.1 predicted protein [Streptomyces viridosporus ATCC 14672]